MEVRRPISSTVRATIHVAFAACLLATSAYYLRLSQERHVALGIHGTATQHVVHIQKGFPADRAGIRVGDKIATPDLEWLDGLMGSGPEFSFLMYRDGSPRQVTLPLDDSATMSQRLVAMPPDMVTSLLVGLVALFLGWWVFARNPHAHGIIPFALWSAVTGPFWVTATWSGYWSIDMWSLNTVCALVSQTALQSLALHWLLIFPRRLVSNRVIVLMYTVILAATAAILMVAIRIQDQPADLMSMKGMVMSAISVVVCFVQLRTAPSLKARRRASWILSGVVFFSLVSFFLWDIPDLLGVGLPFGGQSEEMIIAVTYLAIPVGVAVAITREGLFGIDRFITRGMASVATLLVLFFLYVGAAIAMAGAAGLSDRATIPVLWGFVIACAVAVLARPIHVGVETILSRFFDAGRRRYREALAAFDAGLSGATDRASLEALVCGTVTSGLRVSRCSIRSETRQDVRVAPVAVVPDAELDGAVVTDNLPDNVYLEYPIRVANHSFGTAHIGPRDDNRKFSDEDLLFLERVALRCADHSARMELYEEALRRELEFAQTRLRIAADLHDDIGSNLSGIALMTESAADSSNSEEQLREVSRFTRTMVESLRDIVWSIDPDSDMPGTLTERMRDAASSILGGIPHAFEISGELGPSMSPVFRRNVFLIFKEAIHNIARHANATRVDIRVVASPGEFRLLVKDDGIGFDVPAAATGLGQKTMALRADRIGGKLDVESSAASGTTVELVVPMA